MEKTDVSRADGYGIPTLDTLFSYQIGLIMSIHL